MTTEIRPALTAEEWSGWQENEGLRALANESAAYLVSAIAIANHSLPDDDPRRITKADVADLAEFTMLTDNMLDSVEVLFPLAQVRRLALLYRKLSSLLPPEGAG